MILTERATTLDQNWRESRREEERLRERKEQGGTRQQEQRQTMPRPLVWQRRQMPSQQATTRPTLMEGVERTNAVIVQLQQRTGLAQCNPYAMEVDRERNCYTCGGFGHMARHCRNSGRGRIEQGRRVIKIVDGGLHLFLFFFHLIFLCLLISNFYF